MTEILDVLELRERLRAEQIRTLVHRFYEQVQPDALLGPVFAARIAADGWPVHLDKMVRFWSTVLLGERSYTGNPMLAHLQLDGIAAEHFARWLALFGEVARACMPADVAASVEHRAQGMAQRLQAAVVRR